MRSFRYTCLVHDRPYVAIRHGLYHLPPLENFYFARMPGSDQMYKIHVGFCPNKKPPIVWVCSRAGIMNFPAGDTHVLEHERQFFHLFFILLTQLNIESG